MFVLGRKSIDRLSGVNSDVVDVVRRAIDITQVDFGVAEGVRSTSRQRLLVASGASTTMNSKHLTGDAVDLQAYVGGEVRWDWPLYYKIAEAMKQACIELNKDMIWGGVWDRQLQTLGDLEEEVAAYVQRRRERGLRVFLDGPHFERVIR